jgi:porphobilinogen deaminase
VPVGIFASAVDDSLNIIACHADPDTGDKTVTRRQNLKGQTEEIAEEFSEQLLSAMNENITHGYRA